MRTERFCGLGLRIGCAAAIGALAAVACGQGRLLKSQFKPGQTVYVERTNTTHQTMTGGMAGEQGMTLNVKQLTGVLQTVESADANGAKLRNTIDRFMIESDAMMMDGTFDSDARSDDESPEFAEIFSPMIGESYQFEVDAAGAVSAVSGVDRIVEKMKSAAGASMMLSQLTQGMNNEQFKTALQEGIFLLYPGKEVKPGDVWSVTLTRNDAPVGPIHVKYDLRVESLTDDRAVVAYDGTLTQPEGASTGTANPMIKSVRVKNGKVSGKATFDREGQLAEDARTVTSDLEIELNAPAAEGQPAPVMTVSSSSTQTLKVMSGPAREKQRADNKQAAEQRNAQKQKADQPDQPAQPAQPGQPAEPGQPAQPGQPPAKPQDAPDKKP